jgi:phosphoglucomutase
MEDGSRFIFRLSRTTVLVATVRMYLEQYAPSDIDLVD